MKVSKLWHWRLLPHMLLPYCWCIRQILCKVLWLYEKIKIINIKVISVTLPVFLQQHETKCFITYIKPALSVAPRLCSERSALFFLRSQKYLRLRIFFFLPSLSFHFLRNIQESPGIHTSACEICFHCLYCASVYSTWVR